MKSQNSQKNEDRNIFLVFVAILVVIGLAYFVYPKLHSDAKDIESVNNVVETFGKRMQDVNLKIEDQDVLSLTIEKEYGDLVISPDLLVDWLRDPSSAPGTQVSSPWPDHIEILSTEKQENGSYEVKGNVVQITSNELSDICIKDRENPACVITDYSVKQAIDIIVEKNREEGLPWLISKVTFGDFDINEYSGWERIQNDEVGFFYKYPKKIANNYVLTNENWLPQIIVDSFVKDFNCDITKKGNKTKEIVTKTSINNNDYCVTTKTLSQAGTNTNDYNYQTFSSDKGLISVLFSLDYVQCSTLGKDVQEDCKSTQKMVNIDNMVDKIVRSIEL
ncbi:MAG: hypothetical protein PHQ18_01830 [Patescibacteria group bacterium]|nr:hypothetical protein [Patescibacteria group bacterium]